MCLKIYNKSIEEPIIDIIKKLREDTGNKFFKDIINKGNNILVTCPHHKDGQENHPSCNIYNIVDDNNLEYGRVYCFTCGYSASLPEMVADCFESDLNTGKDWLINNFGTIIIQKEEYLPAIELNNPKPIKLSKNILKKFDYKHNYLINRGISQEILNRFCVGYDPKINAVTFPVWNEFNDLVMITKREISTKKFYIDANVEKPVYLLNEIIKCGIDKVYVCESQINALTCWTWGYPAIALIGTGSQKQYEILNKCGIRNYILCFDGDNAGNKGIKKFKENMRDDVFVSIKIIPKGKDVNDLSKEEFDNLEIK